MARIALLHQVRSEIRRQLTSKNFHSGYCHSGFGPRILPPISKPNLGPTFNLATLQRGWASQSTAPEDDSKITIGPPKQSSLEQDNTITYNGPISRRIKKVKLLSLSTCCLSVSLGPVITFMTLPEMNVILKGGMASMAIFVSASTTAALHWLVSPYVHKLKWQPGSDHFDVETLSWLASSIPKTIKFSDIRLPETNRPYVTFKANGNFYFVDEEHCHNKALLARLTPTKSSSQDSVFKNL